MALQIANPKVVEKIDRLAKATGMTKTAAVEKAVDALLALQAKPDESQEERLKRIYAILEQIDRIPDKENWVDPLEWDEFGLPK